MASTTSTPMDRRRPRRRNLVVLAATACLTALACPGRDIADARPARIVSLNLCTDELVLRLAAPDRIASVTWLAREPGNSNVADAAAHVPINHGFAEEVAGAKPDAVVAGRYTARNTVALLKRTGTLVTDFDVPRNLDDVRRQMRVMARILGETAKAEHLIEAMDRRLAAVAAAPTPRARAIVLNPNGATVGRGTLVDEIMTRAGLDNAAAQLGIDSYDVVPLETVVTSALDVLIVGASSDEPPAMAMEILRHPVLAKMADRVEVVILPKRLLTCGGPQVVDAIERLRDVVETVARKRAAL